MYFVCNNVCALATSYYLFLNKACSQFLQPHPIKHVLATQILMIVQHFTHYKYSYGMVSSIRKTSTQ